MIHNIGMSEHHHNIGAFATIDIFCGSMCTIISTQKKCYKFERPMSQKIHSNQIRIGKYVASINTA